MLSDASSASEQPPAVREAEFPFNKEEADFVLRTVDGVHFRVFRTILILASGGFAGMLHLPQPPAASSSEEAETPGVDVPEDSETMDTFLRICYPHVASEIEVDSLSRLRKVLAAGQKYDAPPVVDVMRRALVQPRFLDDNPLVVFAIACCLDLEEEAKDAARVAVMKNRVKDEVNSPPEMDSISAGAYYRLVLLNQTRIALRTNVNFDEIGSFCRNAPPFPDPETTVDSVSHPFTDADADIVLVTSDSLEFRVHSTIIELASPNMLGMLVQDGASTAGQQIYNIKESSAVIDPLLRFCYPGKRPQFTDAPNTFLHVLTALKKYGLDGAAEEAVRTHWSAFAEQDAFRFFFHAIALNLGEEAQACARLVAESENSQNMHTLYVPEMESVGSLAYRRLLAYVKRYRDAATHGFQLSGFRARPCPEDRCCACRTRCPQVILVRSPTAGFEGVFREIRQRLEKRPSGRALSGDLSLVGSVLDAMHAQRQEMQALPIAVSNFMDRHGHWTSSPNLNGHFAPPLPPLEFLCAMSAQVEWASSLLQCYADAVDGAVSQVDLDLSNVIGRVNV